MARLGRLARAPGLETAPRGVYRYRHKVRGRWVYYALASTGEVLDCWRPRKHETDADVVWALSVILRIEDRRHLRLVRLTRPADAPSWTERISSQRPA